MNWQKFFDSVPDFRINRRKKHQLVDILVIALCAIVSGADDFEEIEAYGKRKESFLKGFLDLPNGIPSHDTFNRVFKYMDKNAFGECLYSWSKELLRFIYSHITQINVDGKVLRGTAKAGFKKSGICIISAWVAEQHLVLGQEKVDTKSNEKMAIPELLKSLALEGCLVSSDAAGCQVKNADLIVEKGGDYLIAIKKDHKHIYEQITDWMDRRKIYLPVDEWVDFGSGRIERRNCYVESNLKLLDDLSAWKHLKSIVMIEAHREKNGKTTLEKRFYLSSLKASTKEFNQLVRNHWSIENQLHWKLDVIFREDSSRTKSGNAAENLTTARKLALQLLHQIKDKESIKNRRKIAGWDDHYLIRILQRLNQN
ncbi:putative transposase YbfD/YdcC [Catalinimonas alkaloidigena]|uniref:ISAs1 family transposase n=1 Tax=Catalinimonas alkaloidigena TaxID=1075417 RepID=UPI0024051549|nr:ISAs1 family transposase [Catalinimonas alkaloidigena]MDF9795957.1 putative transposase YbfD/YdcC [Catalinimonas alkaloidigena]MDF9796855.1 putative transposase YbfD/YdcC [Catalinimonas alkaloidigena]MDF9797578.1 putative transposase YbfD/YdcC [Catalinimonas alkaloidigena]MDF9797718.1 putative transposase YbfD/YdcC [Catalinimonas alkaloidigena]